jgi:putative DNA primase/helicase
VERLRRIGGPLYLVNGEPSVWACAARGVPAVCLCGERVTITPTLVDELRTALGDIALPALRIVLDNDHTGRQAAQLGVAAFRAADWLDVVALDLAPTLPQVGADVDDLHQHVGAELAPALAALPPLGDDGSGTAATTYTSDEIRLTDVGNARRLVATYGEDLRYCKAWKSWLVWNGVKWTRDDRDTVTAWAKAITANMFREAADAPASHQKALVEHALRSQRAERLRGMVQLAQSERGMAVVPGELDAHPWLLTVLNGTIDLRTGKLREHRRADLITKLAPVEYHPAARSDLWQRFLLEATGEHDALAAFLRRAVGYSLTGDTGEEVLFFIHGPEAAGKSTFIEAIKAALGDYARTADFETFLQKRGDGGIRNDIARLAGARLVVSIEIDEGKRLAQGLVKQLTGGDTVTARFLWAEAFEFQPQFKLWLAANHAPKVCDTDGALWRRILRVPFEHIVPQEQRDKAVKATLKDPALAGAAILAWAVAGCLEWQQVGLGVPPEVMAATATYRESQDPLREFYAECCLFAPEAWTASKALYAAYCSWARDNGDRNPLTATALGLRLSSRGCTRETGEIEVDGKKKKARGWRGIALHSEQPEPVQPVPTRFFGDLSYESSREGDYREEPVPTGSGGTWGEV